MLWGIHDISSETPEASALYCLLMQSGGPPFGSARPTVPWSMRRSQWECFKGTKLLSAQHYDYPRWNKQFFYLYCYFFLGNNKGRFEINVLFKFLLKEVFLEFAFSTFFESGLFLHKNESFISSVYAYNTFLFTYFTFSTLLNSVYFTTFTEFMGVASSLC